MALETGNTFKRLRNRYRLVVMNDDTYEEVVTFKLSRLSVYVVLSTTFVIMVGLTTALLVFTPLKYYIPGFGTRQSKAELQLLKIRTDSLEQSIKQKDRYLNDIRTVLVGQQVIKDTTAIEVNENEETND